MKNLSRPLQIILLAAAVIAVSALVDFGLSGPGFLSRHGALFLAAFIVLLAAFAFGRNRWRR
jgi:hypothetical protein